jgi:hypothetical protein
MPKASKYTTKLGRNPLKEPNDQRARTLPALEVQTKTKDKAILEKIKELQIQIDWKELCRAALDRIL